MEDAQPSCISSKIVIANDSPKTKDIDLQNRSNCLAPVFSPQNQFSLNSTGFPPRRQLIQRQPVRGILSVVKAIDGTSLIELPMREIPAESAYSPTGRLKQRPFMRPVCLPLEWLTMSRNTSMASSRVQEDLYVKRHMKRLPKILKRFFERSGASPQTEGMESPSTLTIGLRPSSSYP